MNRTYIVAEAGVNHNGSIKTAIALLEAARDAGADSVKFQTFRAEHLASSLAPKAPYQTKTTCSEESQLKMLKRLELGRKAHHILVHHCRASGIEFLSTPFDIESLEFLINDLRLERIKISSGDLTNAPLLLKAATFGIPIILSTGMSTMDEIETALGVLAFGYIGERSRPSLRNFQKAYHSGKGKRLLKDKVILLQCTTEYPAPLGETNLGAMDTMRVNFGVPVGFSDHTKGMSAAIAAAALGSVLIEKHMTLDRKLPGPDHRSSLEPAEMKRMISGIRKVELAVGSASKIPSVSELMNKDSVRKSLVAAVRIKRGECFSENNLTIKRPGTGVSPTAYWEYIGKRAARDYKKDDVIEF